VTAPILGLGKKERVDEAVKAVEFELSEEERRSIEELYEPKAVVGHK
jgi:diketogulonate reductase-like aldo/keto reductase